MEESLNRYSEKNGYNNSYNWQKIVDNQRNISNINLKDSIEGRGFKDSNFVIKNLPINNENHILAAKIQAESGLRVNEVSLIKKEQLRGIGKDPYNKNDSGVVTIKGKGGKVREVYLRPETYKILEEKVKESEFKIGKTSYTAAIKEAALRSNQIYTGTHDFRHKWVQDRYVELCKLGFSERQSMAAVSEEIGHVRPDITEVYLK
jgi:integrase